MLNEASFFARGQDYYDSLLKDLDERYCKTPVNPLVPSLNLRKTLATRSSVRPNTTRLTTVRPATSRSTTDRNFERESRRIDFLCEKEAQQASKTPRPDKLINKLRGPKLKGKELDIERDLTGPYRCNPEKLRILIERVRNRELRKRKILRPPSPVKKMEDTFNTNLVLSEKRAVVAIRRSTMIASEYISLQHLADTWQEKLNLHTQQQELVETSYKRKQKWLTLITIVNKMIVLGNTVKHMRKTRAKDIRKWRAILTIQKYWKKYREKCRGKVKETLMETLRRNMGEKETDKKIALYRMRVEACEIITSFLRNKGFKVAVIQFIWKVKQLQRKIRRHIQANRARADVIQRCIDMCLPSLLLHIHIVYAGRGYDLKTVTSYEEGQMQRHLQASHNHRFVKQMQTASFHAFLRSHIHRFVTLLRENTNTNLNSNKNMIETVVRRPLMLEKIFKKRKQFSLLFNSQMRLDIAIPKVTINDVRSFIQGGIDPVQTFLQGVAEKELDMIANYERRRKAPRNKPMSAVVTTLPAVPSGGLNVTPPSVTPTVTSIVPETVMSGPEKLVNCTMLFLTGVTVEELAMLQLSIAERANHIAHASHHNPNSVRTTSAATAAALSQYADLNPALLAALNSATIKPDQSSTNRRMSTMGGTVSTAAGTTGGGLMNPFMNDPLMESDSDGFGGYSLVEGDERSPRSSRPSSRRPSTVNAGERNGTHQQRKHVKSTAIAVTAAGRLAAHQANNNQSPGKVAPPMRPKSAAITSAHAPTHRRVIGL